MLVCCAFLALIAQCFDSPLPSCCAFCLLCLQTALGADAAEDIQAAGAGAGAGTADVAAETQLKKRRSASRSGAVTMVGLVAALSHMVL